MRSQTNQRILTITAVLCTLQPAVRAQNDNVVVINGPVMTVRGSSRIQPAGGTGGFGGSYNFLPYTLPGEYANPNTGKIDNDPFDIAYTSRSQPVQTSDWWTGIGLQWRGWVSGLSAAEGQIGRSTGFISEPFQMQFVDVNPIPANQIPGISLPVSGLRLWNQNTISVKTDGKIKASDPVDYSLNFAGRGEMATQGSPAVTVGLANVKPLGLTPRTSAPFSNVKVQSYSDWGAVVGYSDTSGAMQITMAAGSPYVWFERTQGSSPLTVWAGDLSPSGDLRVWYNQGGVLGLSVTTVYNPYNGMAQGTSVAHYAVIADSGQWTLEQSDAVTMFQNGSATRLAVLAMPHNLPALDNPGLLAALNDLSPYACKKISGTKVHFPPIPGSDATVTDGGQTLPLGYDEKNATLRIKHEVLTTPFPLTGCPAGGPALQLVFPHHRKVMLPSSQAQILQTAGAPKYVWNGVIGEMHGYGGSSYVRALRTKGQLPFLPSVAIQAGMANPLTAGQTAAQDIYESMKTWLYVQEPVPPPNNLDSVLRNVGTYSGVQTNSYMQSLAALYESMVIADQMAQSTKPDQSQAARVFGRQLDQDFLRTRADVSAEMRDLLLENLKELVGQWADVYTAQFFNYDTKYNSTFGRPDGYGSVQNFNDHHYHYGYFLRAAAMIGRSDPSWLQAYMPMIDQLRRDVATYDRSDTSYPFLREFSPFYGHSWSNGTADAGGNDQESTSEALNFAVGLIELGQLMENKEWRDLGMYLFEEEVLATEQYWFNQDANLSQNPAGLYNGNWPASLVRFQAADGTQRNTTLITNAKQFGVFRNTFFGGVQGAYTIQATPLSAFTMYLARNQDWLTATWQQYLAEVGDDPGVYEVVASSLQARLPGTGTDVKSTGLVGALKRIARVHNFFQGSTNAMGKYWAYSNAQLGIVDDSVLADTATYGVFLGSQGRTFVAYNPTGSPLAVNFFREADNTVLKTMTVPAHSMATVTDSQANPLVDDITPYTDDDGRMYLRNSGRLLPAPGSFQISGGQYPFPSDASALTPSLEVVPVRPDKNNSTPLSPPAPAYVKSWTGRFSGRLNQSGTPLTRFSIYGNQSLNAGWQQDITGNANVVTVRFLYDFNSDGTADRVEILQNVPVFYGNSFLYKSKITEFYFDQTYGGSMGQIPVFVGDGAGGGVAQFPANVTNGTLTVQVYGGSSAQNLVPFAVSEESDPLLNRASWVKPPYSSLTRVRRNSVPAEGLDNQ